MMKLKTILPICFVLAMLAGCSSDDDSTPPPPEENQSNYFPLTIENSWTYNNENSVDGQAPTQSVETMTVVDSTEENGRVYYDLETDNTTVIGFATSVFSNGELSKTNGKLVYSGELELAFVGTGNVPLSIPIDDAVVFDASATAGTELFNFSGSVEQEVTFQGQTIPISLNYTISTHNVDFLDVYSVDGTEFENVLVADLKMTASIEASLGPIQVTLMSEQEIVNASTYYADGVGMIYSNDSFQAEFEDLSNFGVPTIPPINIQSNQKIDTYTVAP